jgi:two-component system response regulator NreC
VRAASLGERYLSRRVESLLRGGHRPRGGGDGLTPRETEVLSLIALGHTSAEIAGVLRVSPRTVETHRARVHKKLGLATRAELVRYALASGLLRG